MRSRPFGKRLIWCRARYYQQPVDQEALVEGAINGMLETLDDPHTIYLSPGDETARARRF